MLLRGCGGGGDGGVFIDQGGSAVSGGLRWLAAVRPFVGGGGGGGDGRRLFTKLDQTSI